MKLAYKYLWYEMSKLGIMLYCIFFFKQQHFWNVAHARKIFYNRLEIFTMRRRSGRKSITAWAKYFYSTMTLCKNISGVAFSAAETKSGRAAVFSSCASKKAHKFKY